MVRTKVDLPGSVLALMKVDKEQLGPFIKRSLDVELYREGRLSGQGCRTCRSKKANGKYSCFSARGECRRIILSGMPKRIFRR